MKAVPPAPESVRGGFTLPELLALLVVLALLCGLLLPATAHARGGSQGTFCLSNLEQLTRAWAVYSADSSDKICKTGGLDVANDRWNPNHKYQYNQWCMGNIDPRSGGAMTNTLLIQDSLLYPYVGSLAAYKCPADISQAKFPEPLGAPRVRSYCANCWMNPYHAYDTLGYYSSWSDLQQLTPAGTFTLGEEASASINTAWFLVNRFSTNAVVGGTLQGQWFDAPGSFHGGAGAFAFADGHCEVRHWTDPVLVAVATNAFWPGGHSTGPDLGWLEGHAIAGP